MANNQVVEKVENVNKRVIPFSPPDISELEIAEVAEALRSGWITTGPRTKELERRLADYCHTSKVVCLNSATAAEELNFRICGIGEGDEVIVPAYTYTASASAAIHTGARVVFVDSQPDNVEMDYDAVAAAITEKTKAVVAVDLGGIICDYDKLYAAVESKRVLFRAKEGDDLGARIQRAKGRVLVFADCAHALGASWHGKMAGEIADFTDFSFHAVKNFTTAEGGASTWLDIPGVDNEEIYHMYQLLSLHGQSKDALAKTQIGAYIISGDGIQNDIDHQYIISNKYEHTLDEACSQITGYHGGWSWFSTRKAISILDRIKPDVIIFGNLHGAYINIYKIYEYVKKQNIPCVQIMWDEYPLAGGCAYSYDCQKYKDKCGKCPYKQDYPKSRFFDLSALIQNKHANAYDYNRLVFVGVPFLIKKARESSILKSRKLIELDEAVNQDIYYPRETKTLREKLGIPIKNRIILDVCVYTNTRKGGTYFLKLANKCQDITDVTFINIGYNGDINECPSNFIPIGYESNINKMAEYYSLADLYLCTSLSDTQPNACLEALSCGTPICGFNISGIPYCAESPFGIYVETGNVDQLKHVIVNLPKKTQATITSTRKYAEKRYSAESYNKKILDIAKTLLMEESN